MKKTKGKKRWYRCSVSWTMVGGCDVQATSLEEAKAIIENQRGLDSFNAEYSDDSFVIDELEESEVQDGDDE